MLGRPMLSKHRSPFESHCRRSICMRMMSSKYAIPQNGLSTPPLLRRTASRHGWCAVAARSSDVCMTFSTVVVRMYYCVRTEAEIRGGKGPAELQSPGCYCITEIATERRRMRPLYRNLPERIFCAHICEHYYEGRVRCVADEPIVQIQNVTYCVAQNLVYVTFRCVRNISTPENLKSSIFLILDGGATTAIDDSQSSIGKTNALPS